MTDSRNDKLSLWKILNYFRKCIHSFMTPSSHLSCFKLSFLPKSKQGLTNYFHCRFEDRKRMIMYLQIFQRQETTNWHIWVSAVQSPYLLVKAVLLLNDKCVVQTPGKSSYGAEEGGKRQEHEGLDDLVVWTKPKATCHRASGAPQKRDSTKEQDQLYKKYIEKTIKHF